MKNPLIQLEDKLKKWVFSESENPKKKKSQKKQNPKVGMKNPITQLETRMNKWLELEAEKTKKKKAQKIRARNKRVKDLEKKWTARGRVCTAWKNKKADQLRVFFQPVSEFCNKTKSKTRVLKNNAGTRLVSAKEQTKYFAEDVKDKAVHYKDVAKESYKQQKEQGIKLDLNKDEREFQAAAIEILETPASPLGRIFGLVIISFVVIAFVWSVFGRIDVHATLQGKLIPLGKVKVIEPLLTGTVTAINVRLGQQVKKEQVLLTLDPTEHSAERTRIEEDLQTSLLIRGRLDTTLYALKNNKKPFELRSPHVQGLSKRMINLQRDVMHRELQAHLSELESIKGEIEQREAEFRRTQKTVIERREMIRVMTERTNMLKELLKDGSGTRARYLEGAQLLYEERANLVTEEGRLDEARAAIAALKLRLAERRAAFLSQITKEMEENEKRIASLTQELSKALLRVRQSTLKAPVTGTVQQLEVHTVGEVVQTGQQLMTIVPEGSQLEVEAMLLNKDKGFVKEGQNVRIKIESFPFTKYGTIDGQVRTVSNDAVQENPQNNSGQLVFPVRVSMAKTTIKVKGEKVQLTPGMNVTAEVKTSNRRVIEFLLTPLMKMADESLRER